MSSRLTLKLSVALAAATLLPSAFAQTPAPAPATPPAAGTTPAAPAASPYSGTPDAPAAGATATLGSLRGRATDPDKAVIPGLTIQLTAADGKTFTTQTTGDGTYLLPNVPPGTYTVNTALNGFAAYSHAGVKIAAGSMLHLNFHLQPEVNTVVNVKADSTQTLSVASDNNASTLTLKGKDLDALSDDPDELSDELNALAGPAAGPNGGQIYIDGFTGGTLPPKSSIREIRINQNPFSAQFDKIGYGRIEVFTKPGTDKFHGQFQLSGNDNVFNTAALVGGTYQPPYHTLFFQESVSGPITKTASFNIGSNYRDIQDNNVVDTTILDNPPTTYNPVNFVQAVFYPQTRFETSPRLDFQLTPTNTLTVRYQFEHNSMTNAGVGGNSLASVGYNSTETDNEIQLSDDQAFGSRVITETRFEYEHDGNSNVAQNPITTIAVQGAFSANGVGIYHDTNQHVEVQSYTSIQLTNHFIRAGGRLRYNSDSANNTTSFAGGFTYGQASATYDTSLATAYTALGYNNAASICNPGVAPGATVIQVAGICNYGLTQYYNNTSQTRHAGIGPSQFNVISGNPNYGASVTDVGLYIEDDWKLRPNFTFTGGLRYETQNQISDHHDFAPRFSAAWGLGNHKGSPAFVIRAGFGIFYDRYGIGQVENISRFNGINQQSVSVDNPNCLTTTSCVALYGASASTAQITYSQTPNLRTPYMLQASTSIEHQLNRYTTATVTYVNTHGEHQLFSQNLRSLGLTTANNYQYVSEGVFKQNQLIVQSTFRGPHGSSLFGYYVFSHANGDTSGSGTFPSVPGNLLADYGRTSQDVHHRLFLAGNVPAPFGISLAPFMIVNSGTPFNVTLGEDLNGDNIFNDRPALCTGVTPAQNQNQTGRQYGCFDKGTTAGEPRIPINYAQGPAQVVLNMRVTRTFGFGARRNGSAGSSRNGGQGGQNGPPPGAGGSGSHQHSGGGFGFGGGGGDTGRKYNLSVGAMVLNVFNNVSYATPQSVLSSPQFGEQTRLAGNIFTTNTAVRRISLQANFTF